MKVVYKNFKAGDLKVQTQNLDDLWYLSNIVDENDLVSGKTFRKIKIGQEPNVKVVKKPVFLTIQVEKVEFHKYSNSLRVSGKV
ncbi:MAG: mRNA surveillance protein Pelota, partial [Nanoarchaeota archaeon]